MRVDGRVRLLLPLIVGLLLMAAMIGCVVWLSVQQQRSAGFVRRTLQVESALDRLQTLVTEAESGQRGYLLTGRAAYLEPYRLARERVGRELDALAGGGDDRALARHVGPLRALTAAKFAELQRTVELRDRSAAAPALAGSDRGARIMAALRRRFDAAREDQARLLERRVERARFLAALARAGLAASAFVAFLTAIWTIRDSWRRMAELAATNRSLGEAVTDRQAATEQVRQLQKMEAVGQLTGGIAHDFNNMLAIVIGSLDMARRRLHGRDDARLARLIDNAAEGAERAALLTARLLAFSRQQPLDPKVVDPNKLVGGMSELLRRSLGEQVRLETVLAGGLWRAFADAGQLENALVNLAVNARDAMPGGGNLTIETANADLDERYARSAEVAAGQYVLISVTDTGTGMAPEVIERAFEPFYTTKGVGRGTGLGLSQVYGYVRQSGGHVRIHSDVGIGTTVKLYLPRYAGTEEVAVPRDLGRDLPRGQPDEIVMIVEDEAGVRHMCVDALRELGYTVVPAANPIHALEQLQLQPSIALLFTDIVMPDMSGRQLADLARGLRPELRILFTTGYTPDAVVPNGAGDRAANFLPKPYSLAQLALKVRELLDRE